MKVSGNYVVKQHKNRQGLERGTGNLISLGMNRGNSYYHGGVAVDSERWYVKDLFRVARGMKREGQTLYGVEKLKVPERGSRQKSRAEGWELKHLSTTKRRIKREARSSGERKTRGKQESTWVNERPTEESRTTYKAEEERRDR